MLRFIYIYVYMYYLPVFFNRSFGGDVSWHESVAVGATYPETDEKITHQIVDRPNMTKQYLSR